MTNAPASPPPGWYPAPDGSPTTWWWDGERWVPPQGEPQPQPQLNPQLNPQPVGAGPLAGLATATQVLLIVYGVTAVATIGVETLGISAVTGFLNGEQSAIDMIDLYDQSLSLVSLLSGIALVATGVLWVLWQFRAAKQVVGRTRRSPGWHVGSWFVPVISLWFPYQNVADLCRAVGRGRPSWLIAWWLLWIVGNTFVQASARVYTAAGDLEQFRVASWLSITGEILLLAAVPLAWLIVRRITTGIQQHASGALHSLVD